MKSPLKCALIDAFGSTISGRIVYWVVETEKPLFFLEVRDPSLLTDPHLTERRAVLGRRV
jgi:hypothetical protein